MGLNKEYQHAVSSAFEDAASAVDEMQLDIPRKDSLRAQLLKIGHQISRGLTSNEVILVLDSLNLISQVAEIAVEMEQASLTDSMTELPNKRALERAARQLNAQLERGQMASAAVFFIDGVKFGQINKQYSDPAGDEAIRQMARKLQGLVRETDFLARKGGDEFVILAVDGREDYDFFELENRIKEAFEGFSYEFEGDVIRLDVSVGHTDFIIDEDLDVTIKRADAQMKAHKAQQRAASSSGSTTNPEVA